MPTWMTLVVFASHALGACIVSARLFFDRGWAERALAAATLLPLSLAANIQILSLFRSIAPLPYVALSVGTLGVLLFLCRSSLRQVVADQRELVAALGSLVRTPSLYFGMAIAIVAVLVPILVAYFEEPWAWDSLGYHLPVVHDALFSRELRHIPTAGYYTNNYPHLGEYAVLSLQLTLSDATFIELGQYPFLPLLFMAAANLVRRLGVSVQPALVGALLLSGVPILWLQLCTNYVDVAYAAVVLGAFAWTIDLSNRQNLVFCFLSLGMIVAIKPSGPLLTGVGFFFVLVRLYLDEVHARVGRRTGTMVRDLLRGRGPSVLAGIVFLLICSRTYIENFQRHGNPIYPVALGPLPLPSLATGHELASMGLREPMRSYGWLERVWHSWFVFFPESHVFDMRQGGFGPIFALSLPMAFVAFFHFLRDTRREVRLSALALLMAALSVLLTPGGFLTRYVLVFGIATILASFSWFETKGLWIFSRFVMPLLILVGMASAQSGFAWGQASVWELPSLSSTQLDAIAIDHDEPQWIRARDSMNPGEGFLYDDGFGLAGRLARRDLRTRPVFVSSRDATHRQALLRVIVEKNVSRAVLGRARPHALPLALSMPDVFVPLFDSFSEDHATIFEVDWRRARELLESDSSERQ